MDDVIKSFLVSIGFAADDSSRAKAERSVKSYEEAVTKAEKAIEDARWAGAKTQEEVAKLARETNLRLAKEALEQARAREKQAQEADKKQKERAAQAAAQIRSLAATTALVIESFTAALSGYAIHVAAKLEAMAYASERTKSSVQDLKVFSQAVSQLGGSAGGALNDLENFAAQLRSNPQGYSAFLKSVGVEARDAQGNLRGAADLYKEFRKNVGERKPYEQQLLYAREMGISEQTWRATDPAKLAEEEAKSRAKYARMGYDPDRAAQDAKGLEHALRDMFESLSIIGEKTASKIFGDLGDNLKGFTTFLEQHGDQIAEILSKVAQVVLEVSKAILQLLTSPEVKQGFDWLLGMFGHVEEGTGKWTADTERIKSALEALAVFVATVFVAKITGAFATILTELKPLLAALAPLLGLGLLAYGANSNGVLAGPGGSRSMGEGVLRTLDPGLADRVYGKTEGDAAGEAKDGRPLWKRALNAVGLGGGDSGGSEGRGASPRAIGKLARNANAQSIIGELKKAGYNDNAIAAIVGSMQTESSFNPNAHNDIKGTHDGLWQWDRTRWPKIKNWIKQQGGDPSDAAWQTRAWIAEHNAKPGDPLYDHPRTARGGAILRSNPSLEDAVHGVRESERFGPGEEGGRAANARNWLPHVQKPADGDSAPAAPAATPVLPKMQEAARAFSEKAADAASRLDQSKVRAIGAATEGFRPEDYFKSAPPVGTSTNNDNSVRHQSYNRGPSTTNIYTSADARETHDLWRRHEDRQKADDLRHASSIFAA